MKKFFKSALLALVAVSLLASCELFKKQEVLVGIKASSASFVDNKVDISVVLDNPSSADVEVALECEGIPSEAISFNKTVTIPAASLKAGVTATVDPEKLTPGTYEATFSIASATGATIDPAQKSCKVSMEKEEIIPEVSISSYSEAFSAGKASLTLALDKACEGDITVTFEVKAEEEDYVVIPAAALAFQNPAVIPAGKTELKVDVTLDESAIIKGVSNYAVIAIASVSENAVVASRKTKTFIEATAALTANLRSDWKVSFTGEYEKEGVVYHAIEVSGVGEGSYYIFPFSKGLVESAFGTDLDKYVAYMAGMISEAIGTEQAYQIKSGENGWLYRKFAVGEYEAWLLGCTAEGYITGDYAVTEFKVEATPEQLAAYEKWLGEWNVSRGGADGEVDKWTISENVPGGSFFIQGIDGSSSVIADIKVEADYDAEADEIIIYTQEDLKVWNDKGTDYNISLIGMYSGGLVGGDFDLGIISKTGDNTAVIKSGGNITMSDGNTYPVTGMVFFGSPAGSNDGYVFNGAKYFYTWPESMTQLVVTDDDPVFNSFIGYWGIKRNNFEWDKTAEEWKPLGEVTDVWTVNADVPGQSFIIAGIEGYSDLTLKAEYNAIKGNFTVKEQSLTLGEYELAYCGIFHFPGNDQAPEGDYLWDNGSVLFTASIEGNTITLTPGSAGTYGDFIEMQYFQVSEGKYFDVSGEGYKLPNTLTRIEAPADDAPRKGLKSASRRTGTATLSVKADKKARKSEASARLSRREYNAVCAR